MVTERLKLYHTFLLNGKLIVSAFVCGPCKTAVWAAPNSFTRMPMMISCTTHNNPAWQNHVYHRFELRHLLKTTAVTGSLCVVCHIRPEMHACLLATLISGRLIASPYPQESARLHWMKTKFFLYAERLLKLLIVQFISESNLFAGHPDSTKMQGKRRTTKRVVSHRVRSFKSVVRYFLLVC